MVQGQCVLIGLKAFDRGEIFRVTDGVGDANFVNDAVESTCFRTSQLLFVLTSKHIDLIDADVEL